MNPRSGRAAACYSCVTILDKRVNECRVLTLRTREAIEMLLCSTGYCIYILLIKSVFIFIDLNSSRRTIPKKQAEHRIQCSTQFGGINHYGLDLLMRFGLHKPLFSIFQAFIFVTRIKLLNGLSILSFCYRVHLLMLSDCSKF